MTFLHALKALVSRLRLLRLSEGLVIEFLLFTPRCLEASAPAGNLARHVVHHVSLGAPAGLTHRSYDLVLGVDLSGYDAFLAFNQMSRLTLCLMLRWVLCNIGI